MNLHYAKAYMTDRLREAEQLRLASSVPRRRRSPLGFARLSGRLTGLVPRPASGFVSVTGNTMLKVEADCCAV